MKNFLIFIRYKQPLEVVEQHTPEHREYLKTQYAQDRLLMSGPLVPRTAGVLWGQAPEKENILEMMKGDPFYIHGVADWEILEFDPVMFAESLRSVFEAQKG